MDLESYKSDLIKQINKYRKDHDAKNLTDNSILDNIAQNFAEQLAKKGKLEYSYIKYNGEVLGESVYQSSTILAPLKLAKNLYDENKEYNYRSKDPEPSNFTQMVWKDTQYIGFGMQKGSDGKYYYVLNYYPTGNVDGQFQKNVSPSSGAGTTASETVTNKNKLDNNYKKKHTYAKREYVTKEVANNDYPKTKQYKNINTKNYDNTNKYADKMKEKFENFFKDDDDFFKDDDFFNFGKDFGKGFGKTFGKGFGKGFDDDEDDDNNAKYKFQINKKDDNKNKNNEEKIHKNYKLDLLNQLINSKKKAENDVNKNKYNSKYNNKYEDNSVQSTSNDFCTDALNAHNRYRRTHHVNPLKLNKDLCRIAEGYARKLASMGCLQHSDNRYRGETLGENLYYTYGSEVTGAEASKNWYGEIKSYNYNGDWSSGTGHFTQMVWKDTKEVGFGKYKDRSGQTYVVANYYPAGNVIGYFKSNVLRP